MLDVSGTPNLTGKHELLYSVLVDEEFSVVAAHVDEVTKRKIEDSQYVDFARLLPRDRVLVEESTGLRLVNRNGELGLASETERDLGTINSFARWDQAFCVFTNIYTSSFPHKSTELTQYNHIIRTAAASYRWENVYNYDKDFRIHMSKNPYRSWGVILQLSWSTRLKEKIRTSDEGQHEGKQRKSDVCWRYNRGKCTYGNSCKFDHKCAICLKFGHGSHNCRRANTTHDRRDHGDRDRRDRHDRRDRTPPRFDRAPRYERTHPPRYSASGTNKSGPVDKKHPHK